MTEAAASNPSGGRVGDARLQTPSRLLSDERLARRAAAGDRAAFEEIFRRYHQDLYRFCLATTGNVQDAQDALQSTMVKVMQALPGEEREIKLKPWLYRIARNESVETLRRRRDSAELDTERMAAGWEVAETAAARERLRGLFSDLEQLPERQRAVLVMRELGGLGFEEIGDAFGTSPAVARQTLYEARQSLRQMEEGREMSCETVTRALSDADGRVTRRRDVRAHLRSCAACRAFRDGIAERRGEFATIAPLPLAVSTGLLQGLFGGQASAALGGSASAASVAAPAVGETAGAAAGGVGSVAGTVGAGAGKVVATSAVVKSAATVAVVAAVGAGAADRSGVIDLPLTGGFGKAAKDVSEPAPSSVPSRSGGDEIESRANGSQDSKSAGESAPGAGGNAGQAGARSKRAVDSGRPGARRPVHAGGPNRSQSVDARSRGHTDRGKSKEAQGGPPQGASRGQGTAAERKPPQANSSPGGGGEPSAKATPAPRTVKPSKPESAPAAPLAPEPAPTEPSADA
jgi:RNA polymerase sigma factor (sigma-70 family)